MRVGGASIDGVVFDVWERRMTGEGLGHGKWTDKEDQENQTREPSQFFHRKNPGESN